MSRVPPNLNKLARTIRHLTTREQELVYRPLVSLVRERLRQLIPDDVTDMVLDEWLYDTIRRIFNHTANVCAVGTYRTLAEPTVSEHTPSVSEKEGESPEADAFTIAVAELIKEAKRNHTFTEEIELLRRFVWVAVRYCPGTHQQGLVREATQEIMGSRAMPLEYADLTDILVELDTLRKRVQKAIDAHK